MNCIDLDETLNNDYKHQFIRIRTIGWAEGVVSEVKALAALIVEQSGSKPHTRRAVTETKHYTGCSRKLIDGKLEQCLHGYFKTASGVPSKNNLSSRIPFLKNYTTAPELVERYLKARPSLDALHLTYKNILIDLHYYQLSYQEVKDGMAELEEKQVRRLFKSCEDKINNAIKKANGCF